MYTIYGHNQCTFCNQAKQELSKRDLPYTYKDVRESAEAMDEYVANANGLRTVPLVMLGDTSLGGYQDLLKHLSTKELDTLDFDIEL